MTSYKKSAMDALGCAEHDIDHIDTVIGMTYHGGEFDRTVFFAQRSTGHECRVSHYANGDIIAEVRKKAHPIRPTRR